ncbi:MAG: phosphohistidine phosphatase [Acidobacteria bacterium]|nr:MAG: phosphohistidine phosphatase [Acidobacteriota bacterium]
MSRRLVRAAGVVPYRVRNGKLRVGLVHRPRYDDWSWPKGKLDPGEDWAPAAVRETLEETGLRVRLGAPLPQARYRNHGNGGADKQVRYWVGEVLGGPGVLEHEVDEVAWLRPKEAADRLSYARDRDQLDALVELHRTDRLRTWPLLVVRHAHAVPRGSWDGPDAARPLSVAGQRQLGRIGAVLGAYAPERVVSSPAVRCAGTVRPWAESAGVPLETRKGLSEVGFEADPSKLGKHLRRLLAAAVPVALCTHRPLLPTVLEELWRRAGKEVPRGTRRMLRRLVEVPMDKGEVLACTMVGAGPAASVVAVERHRPPA